MESHKINIQFFSINGLCIIHLATWFYPLYFYYSHPHHYLLLSILIFLFPSFSSSLFQRRSQYQSHDDGDGSNLVNLQPKGWRRTDLENNGPFPVSQIRIFTPAWTVGCLGNRKELCSVRFSLWPIDVLTTHT